MTDQQRDLLASTSRAVPVVVMIAGAAGFVACVVVAIISVRTDLLAVAGLCAFVACGGYLLPSVKQARRLPEPPAPPPTVGPTPEPEET